MYNNRHAQTQDAGRLQNTRILKPHRNFPQSTNHKRRRKKEKDFDFSELKQLGMKTLSPP